jgi:hypothetical protein
MVNVKLLPLSSVLPKMSCASSVFVTRYFPIIYTNHIGSHRPMWTALDTIWLLKVVLVACGNNSFFNSPIY